MNARELILDSNVVLADVFQETATLQTIERMKSEVRRSGIGLLITKTVKKECAGNLERELSALSQYLRELEDFVLDKRRGNEVDDDKVMTKEEDLEIIQEYFRQQMFAARRSLGRRERLRRLMEYVVTIFQSIKGERSVVSVFTQANVGIVRLDVQFTTILETYVSNVIEYDAREGRVRLMKRKLKISNTNDVRILVESAEYHNRKNPKTVFTTLDVGDIMNAAPMVESLLQLKVRDPLVAVNEVIRL